MMRVNRGQVLLCHIRPDIYEVFAITRTNRLFRIVSNRSAAVELLDEYANGRSAILQATCPVNGCHGTSESIQTDDLLAPKYNDWTGTCNECGTSYKLSNVWPQFDQSLDSNVASFGMPTYENERIEVTPRTHFSNPRSPSESTVLAKISLTGRLDLYASESLERAWKSLPTPRWCIFDLRKVTDISGKGLEALCRFGREVGSEQRAAVLIDANRAKVFKNSLLVIPQESNALQLFGEIPSGTGGQVHVQVKRIRQL
jgi:anti-anti-sigma regulatory factor